MDKIVSTPDSVVTVGGVRFGNDLPLALIAGPCQIESAAHAFECAVALKEISARLGIGLVFKSSFDKANRTSLSGKRGVGLDASLQIFADIKEKLGLPLLTDVHEREHCAPVAEVVDILQIPAFLCRQTDLLIAAAETGAVVNVKKGQFLAPWDMMNVVAKLTGSGNPRVLLTERGTSFGYNTLVSDFRGLPVMAATGAPVIFDATHSVQQPGGQGGSSGGQREFVPVLARAAVAVGAAGVFIETHPDPDNAPSDGPNMIALKDFEGLVKRLMAFDRVAKGLAGVSSAMEPDGLGREISLARIAATIDTEMNGLAAMRAALAEGLADKFLACVEAVEQSGGAVVVTGMGKSGHIGRKIAATLASTGTHSHFVHPAEASHGDLGMIAPRDVVLALSWSGEAPELANIITYTRRFGNRLIAITSRPDSALGRAADIGLFLPAAEEACPNGLAPTTSTTMQLVAGDVLAVLLLERRGFSALDFRRYHPGGKLGAQLLTVGQLMHKGEELPLVRQGTSLSHGIVEMTSKRFGIAAVVDEAGALQGVLTDGDLRRAFQNGFREMKVEEAMGRRQPPQTISAGSMAAEALARMSDAKITCMFVVENGHPVGVLHIHDLLRAGVA